MKINKLVLGLFVMSTLVLSGCNKKSEPVTPSSETPISSNSSSEEHVHNYEFVKFIWNEIPGAYTAVAHYECKSDDAYIDHQAEVTKINSIAPDCETKGKNVWKASYDGHEETKEEELASLGGHAWGEPIWSWEADYSKAVATFTCNNNPSHVEKVEALKSKSQIQVIEDAPTCVNQGSRKHIATITFEEMEYSDEKVETLAPTGIHIPDEYGFCSSCGEYVGKAITILQSEQVGKLAKNDVAFYRFEAVATHKYTLNDLVELEGSEFSFFIIEGNNYTPVTLGGSMEVGDDGYVYIIIKASKDIEEGSFAIYGSHNYNSVGVCLADNAFIGIEFKTDEQLNDLTFKKDVVRCFRVELKAGHSYSFTHNNHITNSEISIYRLDANGQPEVFDLKGHAVWEEPENQTFAKYVYIIVTPTMDASNVYFLVSTIHDTEHGLCKLCGEFIGEELVKNVVAATFSIASHETVYFRYKLEENQIDFEVSFGASFHIDEYISLYILVNKTWTSLEPDDSNFGYQDYSVTKTTDDGYVYLEINNPTESAISNIDDLEIIDVA